MIATLLAAGSPIWTDTLLSGLLVFAVRATVLLSGAWMATWLLRRASAATRHLVWTSAVAGVLALPVLAVIVPAWNVPIVSIVADLDAPLAPATAVHSPSQFRVAAEAEMTTPPASPPTLAIAPRSEAASFSDDVPPTSRAAFGWFSGRGTLAVLWLGIVLILLVRLVVANVHVAAWRRSSRPVEDAGWLALLRRLSRRHGIERPVVLLENPDTDIPVTWGVVYPVILLPAEIDEWSEEQREAVLTHELAHVKRFDAFTQMLGQIVLALLWFHPLAWLAVRRMRLEREHACDDFVLVAGARASTYADDLLGLARRLVRPTAPAAAALAMARRSELEGRLLAILDPGARRTAVRRARARAITFGVIALAVPLTALRPGARVTLKQTPAGVSRERASVAVAPLAEPTASPRAVAESVRRDALDQIGREREDLTDALSALTKRFGDLPVARLSAVPSRLIPRLRADTEPKIIDLQTLIEVTKASKRMTSDHEKGQLLSLIAKRYQRSDALRDAYLESVFTMTSDMSRSSALIALLDRDSLPLSAVAQVLKSTAMMTSDMNKGLVLKRISPSVFADSAVQRAYLDAIVGMTSDMERGAALATLLRQPELTPATQLALLQMAVSITSNVEKANFLLLFLDKQGIANEMVRRAYFKTAESLTADSEYRRVMTAVMR